MKVGIFLANGFEEGEALFLLDILRRAGIDAYSISITDDLLVEGSHNIKTIADYSLDDSIYDYDMIILPGGMPGSSNLRDSDKVIKAIQYFNENDKYIGAICAAPIALEKAGILQGKKFTSYPGEKYESLFKGLDYQDEIVVVDGKLITSRGPALTLDFAYAVVDLLGYDSSKLKEGMLYNMLVRSIKNEN